MPKLNMLQAEHFQLRGTQMCSNTIYVH